MSGRGGVAATALLVLPLMSPAQEPLAQPSPAIQGSAARGQDLFTGNIRFQNRGPACISCHTIGGLSFPNGGTLGPDLTYAYSKLGPTGTQSAMQTLYFRVMTPIYSAHPLAPQEQADLMAFLQQAQSGTPPRGNTPVIILISILSAAFLVILTGFLWKNRVKSVRRTLVYKATRQGARS